MPPADNFYSIKMGLKGIGCEGIHLIQVAEDSWVQLQALVNTVMNF